MPLKKHPINTEVAYTYIVSNKRLTMVAALGVTLGIAVFIFMNSMLAGLINLLQKHFLNQFHISGFIKMMKFQNPFPVRQTTIYLLSSIRK